MDKKDKRYAEKGITLVALVITVIVLLILAGTTITIAINGGDLFTKTSDTKDMWNNKVDEEENAVNEVITEFENYE